MLEPYENLKGFVRTRPPMVVFMLCLGLFAFVLVTLAYYIKTHEIQNPDISRDWNVFLDNFAELELCIAINSTPQTTHVHSQNPSSNAPAAVGSHIQLSTSQPLIKQGSEEQYRNYSASILLIIHPTKEFLSIQHNITRLSGVILGEQLGLQDDRATEEIYISADLPYEWNTTLCSKSRCSPVKIFTCVHFMASAHMFPASSNPPVCETLNETGLEYHARLVAHKSKQEYQTYYCRSRPAIHLKHTFDPTLAVWLSSHDKSVINLHLMHTSYFLFVMVVMLFCYAIIRGKPINNKLTQTEKLNVSS